MGNQKQNNAEFLKQKLKSDVEKAKQEHFENNLKNVKIQTEEMQKLVKIALEKVRAEFQEKLTLIKEIQKFEENLREKMGNYKKEFDDMAIYGEGNLLCEMSLKEVQLRYAKMKENEKILIERKKIEIEKEKKERVDNMMVTFERLKR